MKVKTELQLFKVKYLVRFILKKFKLFEVSSSDLDQNYKTFTDKQALNIEKKSWE